MKNINELSQEELTAIVSYTINADDGGPTIYYDKISAVTDTYIIYDGSTVESIGKKNLKEIRKGKEFYELYKILSASANSTKYIQEEATRVIQSHYENSLQDTIKRMTDRTDKVISNVEGILTTLTSTAVTTDTLCTKVENRTSSVQKSLDKIDVDKLRKDAKEVSESFKPLKDSLQSTIDELQTLFK